VYSESGWATTNNNTVKKEKKAMNVNNNVAHAEIKWFKINM